MTHFTEADRVARFGAGRSVRLAAGKIVTVKRVMINDLRY